MKMQRRVCHLSIDLIKTNKVMYNVWRFPATMELEVISNPTVYMRMD